MPLPMMNRSRDRIIFWCLLAAIVFAVSSYKHQIMSLGDSMIDAKLEPQSEEAK